MIAEQPVVFECEGNRLVGVLHYGNADADVGVVIVVGGPQYRVGSHRQFLLAARQIAAAGVPVLRFDVRGMGDSEGAFPSFEALGPDIHAAIDALVERVPELSGVVLLGLCDAASANLIYCRSDPRVLGLILMNPWVRTPQGEAQAYLRHYYLQRVLQKSFWRKIFSREFAPLRSARGFAQSLRSARARKVPAREHFVERMLCGWTGFGRPVLLAISGRDLTAQEFLDLCKADERWRSMLDGDKTQRVDYPEADHTMSDGAALLSFCDCCLEWMLRLR